MRQTSSRFQELLTSRNNLHLPWMGKLRLKEVERFVRGHRASRWQRRDPDRSPAAQPDLGGFTREEQDPRKTNIPHLRSQWGDVMRMDARARGTHHGKTEKHGTERLTSIKAPIRERAPGSCTQDFRCKVRPIRLGESSSPEPRAFSALSGVGWVKSTARSRTPRPRPLLQAPGPRSEPPSILPDGQELPEQLFIPAFWLNLGPDEPRMRTGGVLCH